MLPYIGKNRKICSTFACHVTYVTPIGVALCTIGIELEAICYALLMHMETGLYI